MPTTLNPSDQVITQYNVQTGGASNLLNNVAPTATVGVPLISQNASSQPIFGTALVAGGGTGNTTFTAYSIIAAGTTATGAFQNVSGLGSSGNVLTSNGAGALPTWQAAGGGSITITGDSGGGLTGSSFTFTGGTTGLTFAGASSTETLGGTLIVSNGGTGVATMTTAYAPICAGTTATGAVQVASTGLSTSGNVLTSNGSSALPSFIAPSGIGASLVLIQSQSTVGSSAIIFSSGITNSYNCYLLVGSNVTVQTGGDVVRLQVSTDGGSTYKSSGYLSGVNSNPYNSTTLTNANTTAGINLLPNVSVSSTPRGNFMVLLSDVSDGGQFTATGTGSVLISGGTLNFVTITGCYNSGIVVNAFKIINSGADNTAGTFSLYGIRES